MVENQKTISEWASKTFGNINRIVAIGRMFKEVDELGEINPEDKDSFEKISNECADILITLYRVAEVHGFDLHACVDHKMQINRARKWKIAGDGTGQHVKE